MDKILRTTKRRLVSATGPLVSYRRLAVAGVAVVLGAGLIAAAPARADDDPTVRSDFSSGFSPASRPAFQVVHGPSRMHHGWSAQRPRIRHRPYYWDGYCGDRYHGDWYYRDRYHRGAFRRGHD